MSKVGFNIMTICEVLNLSKEEVMKILQKDKKTT